MIAQLTDGSATVTGPFDPNTNVYYVWAPSGLTLRATGNAGGDKLGVLPYGTRVEVIDGRGETLSVVAAAACDCEDAPAAWGASRRVEIGGHFARITAGEREGHVFTGYLSRFPPPKKGELAEEWFKRLYGSPGVRDDGREGHRLTVYPAGALLKNFSGEGGGWATYILPYGNETEGLLILNYLADLFETVDRCGELDETVYYDCLHYRHEEGEGHFFEGNMSFLSVRVVDGTLIIGTGGSC